MKIIAFIAEVSVIRKILGYLGEPTSPPLKWLQAQIAGKKGRGFSGDQEPWVRISRVTRTETDEILQKMALKFLSLRCGNTITCLKKSALAGRL
jgi:hypothetical protein